ncbi:MAG TPA: tetratricopeptide repeat protein [Vicinamibacterales bacterium]|nr:tetratricopeptide repeat protein [Vicinamibacterales bacterium]
MTRRPTRWLFVMLLAAAVPSTLGAAERPWRVIRGRNVEVFGQQSPRTLRDIAVELEQFRVVLGNLVRGARQPQALPTEVYIFDDYEAMKPFVPLYQGRPASLGGFCLCTSPDGGSIIVASLSRYSDSSEIIYHEYSHLLLSNVMTTVPVWFNEGLAEYFSTFRLHGDQAQVGRAIDRHIELLRERFIPLDQLLAVDHSSALYNEGTRRSIFYAESWALVHYLLLGRPDGAATINKYINAYANGAPTADALAAAVGEPVKALDADLRRYVNRLLFNAVTYTLSQPVAVDQPDVAAAIAPAEASARLGEIDLRVNRPDDAARRIETAADARPAAGRAQLALAQLRLQQNRHDEAWQALRSAAQLSPNDYTAQYLYGLMLLRGAGNRDASRSTAEWASAAHGALARAVAIHPDSAAALVWLAYADIELDANLEEARDATAKALALAPGRVDYALQLGEVRMRMGDAMGARQVFAAIAKGDAEHEETRRAARLLRLLDERDRLSRPAAAPSARDSGEHDSVDVTFDDPQASTRETLDLSTTRFRLRDPGAGEQRAFGELVAIECGAGGVRFRVRAGGGDTVGTAARMEDVELTAYGNQRDMTIACGARTPPDPVYLTRRADGTAVAVEFMPKGYVP